MKSEYFIAQEVSFLHRVAVSVQIDVVKSYIE